MTSTEYEHVPLGDVSENEDNRYRHFPEKLIIFPSNVLNTFGLLLPQEHISIKKEKITYLLLWTICFSHT